MSNTPRAWHAATVATAILAIFIVTLPVLWVRYPPLIDYPNHLARHYIGSAIEHSPNLQHIYEYQWRPAANLAADVLYIPLSGLFMPEDCERILLGLTLIMWVLAP